MHTPQPVASSKMSVVVPLPGMGVVFAVRDPQLRSRVAIKMIRGAFIIGSNP